MQIVFYDSYCGLCHFAVQWLIRLDVSHQLKFAPINGKTYQDLIPASLKAVDSVILYQKGRIFLKSDAILNSLIILNPKYKILKIIFIIPSIIRNYIYDVIARNRSRKTQCYRYPDQEKYFLP
jgi:predicted DCC family thiol-disulfide oxidoreductase YuxK